MQKPKSIRRAWRDLAPHWSAKRWAPGLLVLFAVVSGGLYAVSGQVAAQQSLAQSEDELLAVCDRSPAVRDSIVKRVRTWYPDYSCDDIPLRFLYQLGSLTIYGFDDLTEFEFDDFDGFVKYDEEGDIAQGITSLLIGGNKNLSTLPSGIFDRIPTLTVLKLDGNSLSNLPADIFDKLTGLVNLRLDDNSLSSLPPDIFENLFKNPPPDNSLYKQNVLWLGDNPWECLPAIPSDVDVRLDQGKKTGDYPLCVATAPSAPTDLQSKQVSNPSIDLSWTSGGDGGQAITKWQYQLREGSGGWGSWVDIPNSDANTRSHRVDGVRLGRTYRFRVRAVNSLGPGSPSAESEPIVPVPASRPGAPGRPTLTAGVGSITATWSPPSDDGLAPITDYDVYYCWYDCHNPPSGWQNWPHHGTATTATLTGLDAANWYLVKVRAWNSAGPSEWSLDSWAQPNSTAPGAPDTPVVVAHRSQHGVWLTVDWTAPPWTGARIWYWQIRYRPANAHWEHTTIEATGYTDTWISDVSANTTYEVQVRATTGPWSPSGFATTGTQPQGARANQTTTPEPTATPVPSDKPIYNCGSEGDDGWYSDGVFVDHSHSGVGCIQDWYWRSDHTHDLLSGTNKPHSHEQ